MNTPMRIALFFDGDNANPKYVSRIIKVVSGFGEIIMQKVYADWSKVSLRKWISPCLIHHIRPEQVFAYKQGKNASDFSLLGDALEMAIAKEIDCACIVSSDSDFTDLVMRMHRLNVKSIVIGTPRASLALVKVCDVFIDQRTLPEDEKLSIRINSSDAQPAAAPKKKANVKKSSRQKFKIVGKIDLAKFQKKKNTLISPHPGNEIVEGADKNLHL